jgi:multicomponent Na+:H+ antiporter subunit D
MIFLWDSKYRKLEIIMAIIQCSCSLLIVASDNLIISFIGYELIALTSIITIFNNKVNYRYGLLHILSGIVLLAGLALHIADTGSYLIDNFHYNGSISHILMLGSLLINIGAYPLSFVMVDAYSNVNRTSFSYLSIYSSKVTIYLLMTMFADNNLLIYTGIIMIFYGIIYSLFENDILKTLCYMMISQLGFLVVAIGVGSQAALHAVALVAFCSIFYQLLLFICAIDPAPKAVCIIISAITISALPFTSGFVSKSFLGESVSQIPYLKNIFMMGSVGVILVMGIKFSYLMFFANKGKKNNKSMIIRISTLALAIFNIILGIFPKYLYDLLPHDKLVYSAYNLENIVKQFGLLAFAGLLFVILLPLFKKIKNNIQDIDWVLNKITSPIKPIRFNYTLTDNSDYLQYIPKINPNSWSNIGLISLWSVALILVAGFVSKYFL